ncbi:CvpA family protein [Arcticibacter sp. MXS-1]|uniref:CvpA family protein n=1 Tax=Arcticibacter sp. MXS-1 TaxID=3341726 RepID=UPI0035A8CA0A
MNLIDVLLIGVICLSAWRGVSNGFILETINLFSWVLSIALTFLIFPHVAALLAGILPFPEAWRVSLSFLITLILCSLAVSSVFNRLLALLSDEVHESRINKAAGLMLGIVGGVVKAAIVSVLLLLVPLGWQSQEKARESKTAVWLTRAFRGMETFVGNGLQTIQGAFYKTEERDPNKLVKLNFVVRKAPPQPQLEEQMLQLVNQERAKAGLNALKADKELVVVARSHSDDMFSRGYFSHISPEGETPFDRIRRAGVPFLTAGENLALAQTLKLAHEGLMKSPGHRANILNPSYGRLGIGILDGGIYGLMVTQNFRD